jgi:hypothetical protein
MADSKLVTNPVMVATGGSGGPVPNSCTFVFA